MSRNLLPGEMLLVDSGRGLTVHLARAQTFYRSAEPTTLCGRRASAISGTPFETNGCLKCCSQALTAGLEQIDDVTGDAVAIRDVLKDPWRR